MSAVLRSEQVLPVSKEPMSAGFRWLIGLLGLVIVVTGVMYISGFASDPGRFPVTNVDVQGTLDYTDRTSLQEHIGRHTQQGFYGMNVDAIRSDVESMAWVSAAHVRRVWPGRLMVTVEEHEPAARFNDNMLVSKSMELFEPAQLERDNPQYSQWQRRFSKLPRLAGAPGRYEAVLDAFRNYELALKPFDVKVKALLEDERRSQTLELANDVIVSIGYESHELRLQRFIDVYERLVVPLNGTPARFDMRYSNGFALSKDGLIGGAN